ncbi:MAG: hypothetical protein PHX20_02485 [Candidatus Omnitrophica bacterium]|nr:hypothetical protein [Candidatus Omnitrophota bacterium]MDD5436389.1 hypothetical protein [Candidatus Omnitrophota bacterium]
MKGQKMTKSLIIACFCILVFSLPCHAKGAKLYKFDDLKFSIECPSGYEAEKTENTVSVVLSRAANKQSFRPIITLSSTPNTKPPIGLEAFFNLVLQNFLKDPNFSITLAEKTKLGSADIYRILYKRKVAPKDSNDKVIATKVLQVYMVEPSRVYAMNYAAAEGDFDGYLAVANEIFGTFRTLR